MRDGDREEREEEKERGKNEKRENFYEEEEL